jgi:hypothetical protein
VKTLDNSGKNFSSISYDNVVKFLTKGFGYYFISSELLVLALLKLCELTMLKTEPKETSLVAL